MSIFLRFHLSPILLLTSEKHKTDPLSSVSLLTPRHPSAQLQVTDQRPLDVNCTTRHKLKRVPATANHLALPIPILHPHITPIARI